MSIANLPNGCRVLETFIDGQERLLLECSLHRLKLRFTLHNTLCNFYKRASLN
jgi:hypothetical protein